MVCGSRSRLRELLAEQRSPVTDEAIPAGTFFDLAVTHVLTTATLDRLRDLYPRGRFEVRRFRPNIVVQPSSGDKTFVENAWIGHTLAIGDQVRLNITGPCPRCVSHSNPGTNPWHGPWPGPIRDRADRTVLRRASCPFPFASDLPVPLCRQRPGNLISIPYLGATVSNW